MRIVLTVDIQDYKDNEILVLLMANALEGYSSALRKEANGGPVVSSDAVAFTAGRVLITSKVMRD